MCKTNQVGAVDCTDQKVTVLVRFRRGGKGSGWLDWSFPWTMRESSTRSYMLAWGRVLKIKRHGAVMCVCRVSCHFLQEAFFLLVSTVAISSHNDQSPSFYHVSWIRVDELCWASAWHDWASGVDVVSFISSPNFSASESTQRHIVLLQPKTLFKVEQRQSHSLWKLIKGLFCCISLWDIQIILKYKSSI